MTDTAQSRPASSQSPDTSRSAALHPARLAGQIVLGLVLGLTLVPALLELAALAGNVSAFKYQGF